MKETTKTSRTAGYLEKIFRALNNDSFGGELEEPIITIQSTPTAFGRGCLFGLLGGGSDGKPAKGTQTGADGQELPKKGNSRRYQCPQCKAIVRATKDLHIICGTCNVDFELS